MWQLLARKQLIGVHYLEVNHQHYVQFLNFVSGIAKRVTPSIPHDFGHLRTTWDRFGSITAILSIYLGYAFASAASGIKAYSALPLCSYSAMSSATITLSLTTFS